MRDNNKICLTNTLNNSLTRRSFRITITLLSQNKQMSFMNSFVNYDYIKTYIVINEVIVFKIYERL